MATSENTFADRLARGKQLKEALELVANYKPQDPTITLDGLNDLLAIIENKNTEIAVVQSPLTTDIAARKAIIGDDDGLKERTRRIVSYCKSNSEFKPYLNSVKQVAKKLLDLRPKAAKPPEPNGGTPEEVKKRNQGEQSFGDLEKLANDLLQALNNIPNYNPNNAEITINGLQTIIDLFKSLNNSVADRRSLLTNLLWERRDLYEGKNGLRERMKRIHQNIAAEYGKDSEEYTSVIKFKY
ncbi:MAG: hypothetical protein K8H86_07930 [Ignavibacteriaceae bacterium]|nr:hypothetical protein [Ignavibacteriaceae bacterium]